MVKEGYKKCPFCAEEIKAEATLCKHCHSRLDQPVSKPESSKEVPSTETKEAGCLGYLVVIVVCFAIACLFLCDEKPKPSPSPTPFSADGTTKWGKLGNALEMEKLAQELKLIYGHTGRMGKSIEPKCNTKIWSHSYGFLKTETHMVFDKKSKMVFEFTWMIRESGSCWASLQDGLKSTLEDPITYIKQELRQFESAGSAVTSLTDRSLREFSSATQNFNNFLKVSFIQEPDLNYNWADIISQLCGPKVIDNLIETAAPRIKILLLDQAIPSEAMIGLFLSEPSLRTETSLDIGSYHIEFRYSVFGPAAFTVRRRLGK